MNSIVGQGCAVSQTFQCTYTEALYDPMVGTWGISNPCRGRSHGSVLCKSQDQAHISHLASNGNSTLKPSSSRYKRPTYWYHAVHPTSINTLLALPSTRTCAGAPPQMPGKEADCKSEDQEEGEEEAGTEDEEVDQAG